VRTSKKGEAGYTLVTLLAAVTIMLIMMAAAVPSWRYVMKNDREEELIFRGGEIADAIARYQQRNGNALPVSLEVLVKGKFLRREYKDPMTKDGKWRFIRPGEQIGAIRPPGTPGSPGGTSGPGSSPSRSAFSSPSGAQRSTGAATRPSSFSRPGATMGAIQGVASTSEEEGLRVFNGRTKYSEWLFLPGQPRDVGRPTRRAGVPGVQPGMPGRPGSGPGLRPGTRPGVPPPPGSSPGLPGAIPSPPRRQ
jgi:type II secretory pathway pseudopilin PulG